YIAKPAFVKLFCFLVIMFSDSESDVARTGMNHNPNISIGSLLYFNKMVSASERTNLIQRFFIFLRYDRHFILHFRHPFFILLLFVVIKADWNGLAYSAHNLF